MATMQGWNGWRPLSLASEGYTDARVKTPGPGRATSSGQKLAHGIQAGLMAYDFDGGRVASDLALMPTELQRRFGEIMFPLLALWAELAEIHTSPAHPLYNEYRAARVMLSHLFPDSKPGLNT